MRAYVYVYVYARIHGVYWWWWFYLSESNVYVAHIKCIVYHHETASPYDITVIVENDEFIDEFGIDENVVNWDFEKYPLYLSEQSDNRIAIILKLCGVKFDYSDGPTAYTWVQLW